MMERVLTIKFIWNFMISFLGRYPLPKNLGYLWNFGFLSGIFLVIQVLTGIILAMFYTADIKEAFSSVTYIMNDIWYGWLVRLLHLNSASFFFFCIYIHIFRGIYYRSYTPPQSGAWFTGLLIYILLMGAAFLGYVLPWGQMSFWAATVITNLLSVLPYIGPSTVVWIWGGYSINNATLKRFYCLHYLIPFIILALLLLHIISLHKVGSRNIVRVTVYKNVTALFYPFFILKDLFTACLIVAIFGVVCSFFPEIFNHSINYLKADPLVTPEHIVPEWYFLTFYAILRCVEQKEIGICLMFFSIIVLFFLPKLAAKMVDEFIANTFYKQLFFLFVFNLIFLGYLGSQPLVYPIMQLSLGCTIGHLVYLCVVLRIIVTYCSFLMFRRITRTKASTCKLKKFYNTALDYANAADRKTSKKRYAIDFYKVGIPVFPAYLPKKIQQKRRRKKLRYLIQQYINTFYIEILLTDRKAFNLWWKAYMLIPQPQENTDYDY